MLVFLLIQTIAAQDVYIGKSADGSIKFTDSPDHGGYVKFDVNGPPPKVGKVNLRNFPLLDAWDEYLQTSSVKTEVPVELLKAICLAESGMNPNARSHVGAMGLMQLMPATAKGLGVSDPWDPAQNIDGSARYMRKQINRFKEYRLAVAAYHAGPGNVRKYDGIPPFKTTQVYVKRVMKLYQFFLTQRPITLP